MSTPLPPSQISTQVREALTRLLRAATEAEARRAEQAGVPRTALVVLEQLADALALPAGELGRRAGMSASALSHALARLERDGLVARGRQGGDARVVLVRLTRDGRRALQPARAARQRQAESIDAAMPPFEHARLSEALETLAAALERA